METQSPVNWFVRVFTLSDEHCNWNEFCWMCTKILGDSWDDNVSYMIAIAGVRRIVCISCSYRQRAYTINTTPTAAGQTLKCQQTATALDRGRSFAITLAEVTTDRLTDRWTD